MTNKVTVNFNMFGTFVEDVIVAVEKLTPKSCSNQAADAQLWCLQERDIQTQY